MIAYKYTNEKFVENVLAGNLKLSLLSYFRTLERTNSQIPDRLEGKTVSKVDRLGVVRALGIDPRISALRRVGINISPTAQINNFLVHDIEYHEVVEDHFILSLCADSNNKFLKQEDYNAVIEVRYLMTLAQLLQEKHPGHLGEFQVKRVRYSQREFDYQEERPSPSAFVKELQFESQNEIRITWKAITTDAPYFITECAEAKHFLRQIL